MRLKPLYTTALLLSFALQFVYGQQPEITPLFSGGPYATETNNALHPCISEAAYAALELQCNNNVALLKNAGLLQENTAAQVSLEWPLKAAAGLTDCSFYNISAYVDQNTATGAITDYNCGTKTYDSHRGTDIAINPFRFFKMDNNLVEVIAAAAGTIIDKSDGNFDKNCASNNSTANYLVVQHTDGSRALYFHMKKNSLTPKAIGATVVAGEYLGIVGSSGNSSGPHLHFEVWSGSTVSTRIDPWAGACNTLNATSWWAAQKPYTEPAIVKATVHTTDIVVPPCPETETLNQSNCYLLPFQGQGLPPGAAKFYIFIRNETAGLTANMSILNPDGTTFNSWNYTSANNYTASYWAWTKTLPTTPGTYTFQTTYNGISCASTFDVLTTTVTASGPTTICQGGTVTLTAPTAGTYAWSTGATSQSISVSAAGTYTVTLTGANGCSVVSTPVAVTVNAAPTAVVTPSGPTTFCQGGSVTLAASAATTYAWSTGASSQSITVSAAGAYTVTVTGANGCSAVSTPVAVMVNAAPTAVVTPSGPTTFCQGGSVTLSASAAAGYSWSTGASTQSITVSAAGNYTVTVTGANGCTAVSAPAAVVVNNLPIASVTPGGPISLCQGSTVTLVATPATAYTWSTGASTQSITLATAGNYTVTVTGANGCTAVSAPVAVTINSAPVAAITPNGPTTICQGDSVTLTATAANAYIWNTGATSQSITVSSNGNFTVTVTGANGCTAVSAPAAVAVILLPAAVVTPDGPTTFCQGGSVTLAASAASTYAWSTGATSQTISVAAAGIYTVTVTNANGCTNSSAPVFVTVNNLPSAVVTAGGPTVFCPDNSVTLSVGPAITYLWNTGANTQTITVSNAGNYTVTVTDANGCTAVSLPALVEVYTPQNDLPIGFNADTLTAPYTAPVTWYLAGDPTPIGSGPTLICAQSGNYFATGADTNGCIATSSAIFIECGASSTATAAGLAAINVFPNPSGGMIHLNSAGIDNGMYRIVLTNAVGQVLLTDQVVIENNRLSKTLNISGMADGVYFLILTHSNRAMEKVIFLARD